MRANACTAVLVTCMGCRTSTPLCDISDDSKLPHHTSSKIGRCNHIQAAQPQRKSLALRSLDAGTGLPLKENREHVSRKKTVKNLSDDALSNTGTLFFVFSVVFLICQHVLCLGTPQHHHHHHRACTGQTYTIF